MIYLTTAIKFEHPDGIPLSPVKVSFDAHWLDLEIRLERYRVCDNSFAREMYKACYKMIRLREKDRIKHPKFFAVYSAMCDYMARNHPTYYRAALRSFCSTGIGAKQSFLADYYRVRSLS